MELIQAHKIECCDWVVIGTLNEHQQLMIPVTYYVDILDEHIIILN